MENIIEIKNLTVSYSNNIVLNDVNLSIPTGVRCAIIGQNGAGKSTLLKSILNFKSIDNGIIKVFNNDVKKVIKKIAYVPQKAEVNWNFPTTVFDVVLMGRYAHLSIFKRASKKDKDLALEALKEMGVENFSDRQISKLSGGQKQRVFIARALAQNANLYMLDEPLASVDINTEKIIGDKFKQLQKAGNTIVCVHHNLYTLDRYFDYLVIVNKDKLIHGYLKDFSKDSLMKMYFGS